MVSRWALWRCSRVRRLPCWHAHAHARHAHKKKQAHMQVWRLNGVPFSAFAVTPAPVVGAPVRVSAWVAPFPRLPLLQCCLLCRAGACRHWCPTASVARGPCCCRCRACAGAGAACARCHRPTHPGCAPPAAPGAVQPARPVRRGEGR